MYLIVGLGNPGDKYKGTRHNVGFEGINKLAFDFHIDIKNTRRFRARLGEGRIGNTRVLLMQPMTYMNLSGEAVQLVMRYYKIPVEQLMVLVDDVNLPVGDIRVRERGSAGGQKGLISIINNLATEDFTRIRIGVGSKPPQMSLSDYVLSRFFKEEHQAFIDGVTKATDAVECILKSDVPTAMNQFNKKRSPKPSKQTTERSPEDMKQPKPTATKKENQKKQPEPIFKSKQIPPLEDTSPYDEPNLVLPPDFDIAAFRKALDLPLLDDTKDPS